MGNQFDGWHGDDNNWRSAVRYNEEDRAVVADRHAQHVPTRHAARQQCMKENFHVA